MGSYIGYPRCYRHSGRNCILMGLGDGQDAMNFGYRKGPNAMVSSRGFKRRRALLTGG